MADWGCAHCRIFQGVSMILSILKVIGIIILVLLAVILLLLFEVLFFPARYEFKGQFKEKTEGDVKVTWFPVLLKVIVSVHDGKLQYIIKAFGGVLMTNTDAKLSFLGKKFFTDQEKEKDFSEEKENMAMEEGMNSGHQKNPVAEAVYSGKQKNTEMEDGAYSGIQGNITSGKDVDRAFQDAFLEKKHRENKVSLIQKLKQKIKKIINKMKGWIEGFKKINEKKEALLKVYHSKRFEKAKKDVILYIKKFIHIIKPDMLKGNAHFGLKDPAATGEVFGFLALFLPLYDEYFVLTPEFEYPCAEGNVEGKGKFRLFPLVVLGMHVIFNKNLIKVTKKVQTIIEG